MVLTLPVHFGTVGPAAGVDKPSDGGADGVEALPVEAAWPPNVYSNAGSVITINNNSNSNSNNGNSASYADASMMFVCR